MKFLTIGCIAGLVLACSALRVNRSHKQEEEAPAAVNIDEAKKELKDQYKEVIEESKQQFKQIDADGDGVWTKEEFDNFYATVGNTTERDASWTLFDANEDGQVPFDEFKTQLKKKVKGIVNEVTDKIKSADTDGDGVISLEEAAAIPNTSDAGVTA